MAGFGVFSASIICLVVFLTGRSSAFSWRPIVYPNLNVNDRIIARWTNNLYYTGKVSSIGNGLIHVLFDDGDRITHSNTDISAVIPDKVPYHVTFDDNDEDYYTANQLRIFLDHLSAHAVGTRVFALWTNGLYYRGFVTSATSTTIFINYDDGDTITLHKNDAAAVILDKLPCCSDVQADQRVIGFWPGRVSYYPGDVTYKRNFCSTRCYQKAVYHVLFNDTDQRIQDFHQIRLITCTTSSRG
ncbi:hypothetical protein ACROYT_G006626 [Oculina patagonica]